MFGSMRWLSYALLLLSALLINSQASGQPDGTGERPLEIEPVASGGGVMGACCFCSGDSVSCFDLVTVDVCDALDGDFFLGAQCIDVDCENADVLGSCLLGGFLICRGDTRLNCEADGGIFFACILCEEVVPDYLGACCLPGGGCAELSPTDCDNAGGLYLGTDVPCSACDTGACCLDGTPGTTSNVDGTGGGCLQSDQATCENDLGGTYLGPNTDCGKLNANCPCTTNDTEVHNVHFLFGTDESGSVEIPRFNTQLGMRSLDRVTLLWSGRIVSHATLTNHGDTAFAHGVSLQAGQIAIAPLPPFNGPIDHDVLLLDPDSTCVYTSSLLQPEETEFITAELALIPDELPLFLDCATVSDGSLRHDTDIDTIALPPFIGSGSFAAPMLGDISWAPDPGGDFGFDNFFNDVEGRLTIIYCYTALGACCLCDGTCIDGLSEEECLSQNDFNPTWFEGETCADIQCADPIGACCLCDGTCIENVTEAECAARGDFNATWFSCQSCDEITCPDPVGACCLCDGQCLENLTAAECAAIGDFNATWFSCQSCDEITCPDPVGACCLCDGTCIENLTEAQCAATGDLNPTWFPCQSCDEVDCPDTVGACCLCDGTCIENLTIAECLATGDFNPTWFPCQSCDEVDCPDTIGACCLCDGTCIENVTEAACEALGDFNATWFSCQSCDEITCPDPVGACCLCDGTCIENMTEAACDALGDFNATWFSCQSCDEVDCPDTIGACCLCDGTCLENMTEAECDALGDFNATWFPCQSCDEVDCPDTIGACCLCDGTCLENMTEAECAATGDFNPTWFPCQSCDEVDCPDTIGACCLCDGTCIENVTIAECLATGDFNPTWFPCQSCDEVDCPDTLGACCLCDGTCIGNMTEAECDANGASFAWTPCVTCADVECDARGACCLCDGTCIGDITEADCIANPLFDSWTVCTSCDNASCAPRGACCFEDGTCITEQFDNCVGAGGVWQGDCTTCDDVECPGACCFCDGTCEQLSASDCATAGGSYQGFDVPCSPNPCDTTGACCFEDESCDSPITEACCLVAGGTWLEGEDCTPTLCIDRCPHGCTEKGSLLIWSKIEIRWDQQGNMLQETFASLVNDYPDDVKIRMYFVNGDEPLPATNGERAHPGWNAFSNTFILTANQPVGWASSTGESNALGSVTPFTALDPAGPGELPGRPALDGSGERVMRGFIYAWAVNDQHEEIRWNQLTGDATIVNYGNQSSWQYNACAFQVARTDIAHGEQTGTPGRLFLDGSEYCSPPARLQMNFPAVGSISFSSPSVMLTSDTEVALHPAGLDLRWDLPGTEPITTKASFMIWNENEHAIGTSFQCVTCWDSRLLSQYGVPNHFHIGSIMTDHARAVIDGVESIQCNLFDEETGEPIRISEAAALLGLRANQFTTGVGAGFQGPGQVAGTHLVAIGDEPAIIYYQLNSYVPPAEVIPATPFEKADAFVEALRRAAEARDESRAGVNER